MSADLQPVNPLLVSNRNANGITECRHLYIKSVFPRIAQSPVLFLADPVELAAVAAALDRVASIVHIVNGRAPQLRFAQQLFVAPSEQPSLV